MRSILGERLRVNPIKANLQSEFDGVNCGLYTIEICKALQPLFGSRAFGSDDIKQKLAGLKLDIVETRINHLKIVNQVFDEQCAELGLSRPVFN